MLRPRVLSLPSHVQGVFVHNLMKVYAVAVSQAEENNETDRAQMLTRALLETLPAFVMSSYLEVQERVSVCLDVIILRCLKST